MMKRLINVTIEIVAIFSPCGITNHIVVIFKKKKTHILKLQLMFLKSII